MLTFAFAAAAEDEVLEGVVDALLFHKYHILKVINLNKLQYIIVIIIIIMAHQHKAARIKPNTHRRRRRNLTVELSCVGGVY